MYQKHVLVVLSDGGDNASRTREGNAGTRRESNALIYTVVDPDVFTPGEGDQWCPRARRRSCPEALPISEEQPGPRGGLQEIAGNIRRGYSIGYAPPSTHAHNSDASREGRRARTRTQRLSGRVRNVYMESD